MGSELRWKLADEEGDRPQGSLFDVDSLVERHIGTGEFRGLEFLHVNAGRIINEVPAASRLPFRYTINAYRGCSHACAYCLAGDTPILMADGRTKPLADLRVGDMVYGTVREGRYRHYTPTPVLAHWSTTKSAFRIRLQDGTEIIASGDHRFLTERGWKHVTGAGCGADQRAYLTVDNGLMGTGGFPRGPKQDVDYRNGYLCGMVRGGANLASYECFRRNRRDVVHRFRLTLIDDEALERTRSFLDDAGVGTDQFVFSAATETHQEIRAIRTSSERNIRRIHELIAWPDSESDEWRKGFLAGMFDAEGGCSRGVLRFSDTDQELLSRTLESLTYFGFDIAVERSSNPNGLTNLRMRGGLEERLRFFLLVDPVITRKRTFDGMPLESDSKLGVVAVEPLGLSLPMFDITTGTGDFIANGVVSHNCFARPTHEYLGLDTGRDFEQKIVVKVNAVERLRAELSARRWAGHHIAMGTNTDPYQRCEGKYHLTRGIVQVLGGARNPFSILTKSTLILRDLDVLTAAAERTSVRVNFSIATLDETVWKLTEPGAPHPRRRVEAVRRLNDAGIPCGVLIAPILPDLSDDLAHLEEVVQAVVDAGAVSVSAIGLHLRPGVREHFMGWLGDARPDLVDGYERRFRRAYQPKSEQEQLAATVRRLVNRARGRSASPALIRSMDIGEEPVPPPVTETAAPSQLSLL